MVEAKFSGRCPECGGMWQPGDLIRGRDNHLPYEQRAHPTVWQHRDCPDDPADTDLKPGEQVCETCWLVHPQGACDR